ncbi:MAG: molybdopterin-dependent oxidoreductase [Halioglobus sp.]
MHSDLPPGQRLIDKLPRFGLGKFAHRFPNTDNAAEIDIGGDVGQPVKLSIPFGDLNRVVQVSDFHCVTTWTACGISWSGFRFSEFYKELVVNLAQPEPSVEFVVFGGQDGYKVGMHLEDLLASDVLLADRLDGQALPIAHGAPLRLVAPAHYGYKSIKHLSRIEFWCKEHAYQHAGFKFMDHPRARVEFEERGTGLPGRVYRWLYRPLVKSTRRKFAKALAEHIS